MNFTSILRPAQKILTTSLVAAVTTTCLVSATNTTSASPDQGSHAKTSDSAKKEYRSLITPDKKEYSADADVNLAKKEYLSVVTPDKKEYAAAADLNLVDQSAYPALSTTTYETRVRYAVNRVRRAHNLRALTLAACPDRTANRWSAHLAATGGFYHQSMTGLLRTCRAHYAGETLAKGSVSPRTIVSMWMHSAPHRHILMSSSPRRIGIGATPDSHGQWVVAANFMRF